MDLECILPFFSSDVNKVSAEVFAPNSKKPLLKIDGEWNGKMTAKWTDTGKTETFIDVKQLPIHKKRCKLITDQRSFESRRLWKSVTYNLKVQLSLDFKCIFRLKKVI